MALIIPNRDEIIKRDPRLGEALKRVEDFTNLNVTPVPGNRKLPPTFVTPTQRPG